MIKRELFYRNTCEKCGNSWDTEIGVYPGDDCLVCKSERNSPKKKLNLGEVTNDQMSKILDILEKEPEFKKAIEDFKKELKFYDEMKDSD